MWKSLEKTLGFPTFSTMPAAALDLTLLSGNQSRSDSPNLSEKLSKGRGAVKVTDRAYKCSFMGFATASS
jgi:hypothetical protein